MLRDKNGRFKKGNKGFWFGKKRNNKTNKKISKTLKGVYSGEKHPNWKGGKHKRKDGYSEVYAPKNPKVINSKRKYVLEHILVMEKYIGRYLRKFEQIHHLNGIKDDNRINNLVLTTVFEHPKLHALIRKNENNN